MKAIKTFLAVLIALVCISPPPLNALTSDVGWCGNYWGGAYVWGFEPWNTIDLHDGRTDSVLSGHYVGLSHTTANRVEANWKAYLEVYIGQSPGDGTVFTRSDFGHISAPPSGYDGEQTSLSINVKHLRPGQIGIYGYTRLSCRAAGENWKASENLYPLFLHGH